MTTLVIQLQLRDHQDFALQAMSLLLKSVGVQSGGRPFGFSPKRSRRK